MRWFPRYKEQTGGVWQELYSPLRCPGCGIQTFNGYALSEGGGIP